MKINVELSAQQFPCIVVIFVTLIAIFAKRHRLGSVRKLPPGPRGWPVVGNLVGMIKNRPVHKWIHRVMDEMQTEIACFRFANVHVIAVTSKEIAREALGDKDEVLADRPEMYSAAIMSGGYKTPAFCHYGDQWKKMKKVMTLKDAKGKPLLTPEEIKADSKFICLATIDSPTNNVEWTLAEMLNHPETLKKAMDELDEIVGGDRLVQESDIPKLNYIKACSREYYRLHPVSPFLPPHVAMEDTILAGYFVPKGSHILVSRVGLGQNPKIWDEPNVFRPERHLGSTEVNLFEPGMRFVSFSAGRCDCIGGKLGTYMTVMLLARLLQGFNWSLPRGSDRVDLVESDTILLMAKPLVASVEPRLAPHRYPKIRN